MREALNMSAEDRARLSVLARQRVSERYSWDAVTDRYEELLSKLARG
jgi:glycosyltransferase involved in cell wall biosynthesis